MVYAAGVIQKRKRRTARESYLAILPADPACSARKHSLSIPGGSARNSFANADIVVFQEDLKCSRTLQCNGVLESY